MDGDLKRWIGDFLTGRRQATKVGGALSSWSPVISGVPQGTVLGPLFFLIFIGDMVLPSGSGSLLLKYVDDTKLLRRIRGQEDVLDLQRDLETLFTWQETNNMSWNGAKFQALRMGPLTNIKDSTVLLTPETEPIPVMQAVKDLGVMVDDRGDFKVQRASAVKKVKARGY